MFWSMIQLTGGLILTNGVRKPSFITIFLFSLFGFLSVWLQRKKKKRSRVPIVSLIESHWGFYKFQVGLLHGGKHCVEEHEPNGSLSERTHNMG